MTDDGIVSTQPATATVIVLPHLWQRGWVQVLVVGLIALAAALAHRVRTKRLLELERVRTRIASDLHDDIGSNLSRMSILSEVAKRQLGDTAPEPARHLTEIGESARTLIDAMSDIVWSIDPRHDDLGSVIVRVRAFASDVLAADAVEWSCDAPTDLNRIRMTPDARRHLLLLLKEGVTNIARHARAANAQLRIVLEDRHLIAELSDDGRGFVPTEQPVAAARGGHGLSSMRWRAQELGARLETVTAPGAGTRIIVTLPVRAPHAGSHKYAIADDTALRHDRQS